MPQIEERIRAFWRGQQFTVLNAYTEDIAQQTYNHLKTRGKWKVPQALQDLQLLIIDEGFSLNGVLFTLILIICQGVRNNFKEPFGGLPVLLMGDMLQAEPIYNEDAFLDGVFDLSRQTSFRINPMPCLALPFPAANNPMGAFQLAAVMIAMPKCDAFRKYVMEDGKGHCLW